MCEDDEDVVDDDPVIIAVRQLVTAVMSPDNRRWFAHVIVHRGSERPYCLRHDQYVTCTALDDIWAAAQFVISRLRDRDQDSIISNS